MEAVKKNPGAKKALEQVTPAKFSIDKQWWRVQRDQENGYIKTIGIDLVKFVEFLYDLGYRRYDIDKTHLFVKITDHRILKEVTTTQITDSVFQWIEDYIKAGGTAKEITDRKEICEHLQSKLLRSLGIYFSDRILYRLKSREEIEFMKDAKDKKCLFYQNGFVEITAQKISFYPYSQLEKYVWQSEILKRPYLNKEDLKQSVFEKFLLLVCNNDQARLRAMMTITGYNLHTYTEMKLKASVFTDSRISEEDEPNGRTGKSLYCKALSQMISAEPENGSISTYCEINGKDFDPLNKHKYQQASLDTKIIILNDVRKNFDVEILFNDITEGVKVERKNDQPFRIRPKMIITTNKTIRIEGDSSKDRFVEFEFGEYFSKAHTPEKEFGHWFFRDWNPDEWSRFDSFIMRCIQLYLEKGLIEPAQINLNLRKLQDHTCREFVEFMDDQKIRDGDELNRKTLYNDFTGTYPDYAQGKLKQARFSRWLVAYTKLKPGFIPFDPKTDEKKNDGDRIIIFRKEKQ